LKLLVLFSENDNQNDGDGEQSAEDINIDHSVINRIHNYSLIKNKSIDQNTKDKINPKIITVQFKLLPKKGPINTEAKNTCPISRMTCDNFSDEVCMFQLYQQIKRCQFSANKKAPEPDAAAPGTEAERIKNT
jgi:hypothetical protein